MPTDLDSILAENRQTIEQLTTGMPDATRTYYLERTIAAEDELSHLRTEVATLTCLLTIERRTHGVCAATGRVKPRGLVRECRREPGHEGPHSSYLHPYEGTTWTDDGPDSTPSPWTLADVAALAQFNA